MIINISQVERYKYFFDTINKTPLEELELVEDGGKKIEISQQIINEFRCTGLNNVDFILSNYWEVKEES